MMIRCRWYYSWKWLEEAKEEEKEKENSQKWKRKHIIKQTKMRQTNERTKQNKQHRHIKTKPNNLAFYQMERGKRMYI